MREIHVIEPRERWLERLSMPDPSNLLAEGGAGAANLAGYTNPITALPAIILQIRSTAKKIELGHYKNDTSIAQSELTDQFKQLDSTINGAKADGTLTPEAFQEAQQTALNSWNGLAKFLAEKGSAGQAGLRTMQWVPQFLTDLGLPPEQIGAASQGRLDPSNQPGTQNNANLAPNAQPEEGGNMASDFVHLPGDTSGQPTLRGAAGVGVTLPGGITVSLGGGGGATATGPGGNTIASFAAGQIPQWLSSLLAVGGGAAAGALQSQQQRQIYDWLIDNVEPATARMLQQQQAAAEQAAGAVSAKLAQPGYTDEQAQSLFLSPEQRARMGLDPTGMALDQTGLQLQDQEKEWMQLSPERQQARYLTDPEQRNMLLKNRESLFLSPEQQANMKLTADQKASVYATDQEKAAEIWSPEEQQKMLFTDADKAGFANLATLPIAGAADKALTSLTSAAAARGGYAPGINSAAELISKEAGQSAAEAALAANLRTEEYNKGVQGSIAAQRADAVARQNARRQATTLGLVLDENQTNQLIELNKQATAKGIELKDAEVRQFIATNRQKTTQGIQDFQTGVAADIAKDRKKTEWDIKKNIQDLAIKLGLNAQQTDQLIVLNDQQQQGKILDTNILENDKAVANALTLLNSSNAAAMGQTGNLASAASGKPADSLASNLVTGSMGGLATVPVAEAKPKPTTADDVRASATPGDYGTADVTTPKPPSYNLLRTPSQTTGWLTPASGDTPPFIPDNTATGGDWRATAQDWTVNPMAPPTTNYNFMPPKKKPYELGA